MNDNYAPATPNEEIDVMASDGEDDGGSVAYPETVTSSQGGRDKPAPAKPHPNPSRYTGSPSPSASTSRSGASGGNGSRPTRTPLQPPSKKKTPAERVNEKQDLLFKIGRLKLRGATPSEPMTIRNSACELRAEMERMQRELDSDKSVKFQRSMLTSFATGLEFVNSRWNVAGVKLEGWSESLHADIASFDEVFEELHEKYMTSVSTPPELKLVMMVASSAIMFHMSQTVFRNAPGVEEVMRENPDIARKVAEAIAKRRKDSDPATPDITRLFTGRPSDPAKPKSGMSAPDLGDVEKVEQLFSDGDSDDDRETGDDSDDIQSLVLDA